MARSYYSYLILSDGSVVAFGNLQGGTVLPPTPPPGVGFSEIRPGQDHWLALRTDGQVVAWGDNSNGECDVPPLPPGTVYTTIGAGWGYSHAARSDGVIVSWGQLWGFPVPPAPVLPAGVSCTQIACGQLHTLLLLSDGKVLEWGLPWFFATGVPSLEAAQGSSPTPLWFVDASVNLEAGLAVLSDGRIVGIGDALLPPSSLTQGRTFSRVRYCGFHSAAMTDTGDVLAWGNNTFGQSDIPPLPPGVTYTDFDCSLQNTLLVRSDGQAIVIGSNNQGQANVPALPPGVGYVMGEVTEERTILLRSDGQAVSFGAWTTPNPTIVPPLPPGAEYIDVAASVNFNTVVRSDGRAFLFGSTSVSNPAWRGVPGLPPGVYYVEADGGSDRVILRRSDGRVEVAGLVALTGNASPVPDPGTSYVQVSGGYDFAIGRIAAESTYVGIASGCAGTRIATRLVPRDTPKIGRTLRVTLFDLPLDVAVLAMSFQQVAQPIPLASLGMAGCEQQIVPDAVALVAGQDYHALWSLPIPDQPSLIGVAFHHQALVLDPGANAIGLVVSDTARGVVGDR